MIRTIQMGFCCLFILTVGSSCDLRRNSSALENASGSLSSGTILAAMPDSVASYIHAALDSMQMHSIRKDSIDWKELRVSAFKNAEGATTYAQAYPSIQKALAALGDRHSFFKTPDQYRQWIGMHKEAAEKIKLPRGFIRDGGYAYISVNAFSSGDPEQLLKYASHLQKIIKKLDSKNPKGWVIDLTYNFGGNMWPMLAGLGPLAGEGKLGHFLSANGTATAWSYQKGEVRAGDEVMLKIPHPYTLKNKDVPVALLVSDRTASSGEAILLSFKDRPNTRIFGEPTAGLSTANKHFSLVDDAQLILTSAVFTDRNNKKYGSAVLPDVDYSEVWYFFPGFETYIMIEDAKEWITDLEHKKRGK